MFKKIKFINPKFFEILNQFYKVYGYKQKLNIFTIIFGAILSGLLEILGIVCLYLMIRLLIQVESLPESHFLIKTFNLLGINNTQQQISYLGLFIAITFITKNLYILGYYVIQHKILRKWKSEFSQKLMAGYLHLPYEKLLGYNSAEILRNINSTVTSALNGFILSSFNFITNLFTGAIILSLIYFKYFGASMIIASILILATIAQNIFLKKTLIKVGKEKSELIKKQTENVYQGIHSIKETKVLGKEHFFIEAFKKINFSTVKNDSKSLLLSRLPSHLTEIVIIISVVILCISILSDNDSSSSSIASLGALAAIAFRIAPVMNRLTGALQNMNKNTHSVVLLLDELKKVERPLEESSIETIPFNHSIRLENVSFKYPMTKTFVLKDINLEIKKNEFIGIVGLSGAGKTTLIDIILGLLKPTKGNIYIDDKILNDQDMKAWQKNMTFVPQNIQLSDDTLASNIAFGINKTQIKRDITFDLLRKCQLMDISAPKGVNLLDYRIGEQGKNLSGGQKQRVAIARSLYQDRPIMILDEATSALDLQTEYKISETLNKQKAEKTIISIAHRLSTIINADRIVFMDSGKIEQIDCFENLRRSNLKFKKLANLAYINN